MGAVASQRQIEPDARNLGLKLKPELVQKEPTYTAHAPGLATVNGNGTEPSSGSESVSGAPKNIRIGSCLTGRAEI